MDLKYIWLRAQNMLIILGSIVNVIGTTYIINVTSMRSFNLTKDKIIIRAPKIMRKVAPASISTIHMFHMLVGRKKVTIYDPSPFMILAVRSIHKNARYTKTHWAWLESKCSLLFLHLRAYSHWPMTQSCWGLIRFIPILLEASWKVSRVWCYFPWCLGSGVPPRQEHWFTRSSTLIISACGKVLS